MTCLNSFIYTERNIARQKTKEQWSDWKIAKLNYIHLNQNVNFKYFVDFVDFMECLLKMMMDEFQCKVVSKVSNK